MKGDYFLRLLYLHPKGIRRRAPRHHRGRRTDRPLSGHPDTALGGRDPRLDEQGLYARKTSSAIFGKIRCPYARFCASHDGYGRISGRRAGRLPRIVRLCRGVGIRQPGGVHLFPRGRHAGRAPERARAKRGKEGPVHDAHGDAEGDIEKAAGQAERTDAAPSWSRRARRTP